MALSWYIRKRLLIAGAIAVGIASSMLIPPSESHRKIETDRPWAKSFRDNLFEISSNDVTAAAQISKDLCAGISSELKQGVTLSDGMKQIDTVMQQIGAHIGVMPAHINEGFITYYYQPMDTSVSLKDNYERALSSFATQSIGPKYNWLNVKWYGKHRDVNMESVGRKFIKLDGPLISVSFETPFPLLDEFTTHGILQTPPPQIKFAADYAQLKFVRAERRDNFSYTYAIDMRPWYQKRFGGNQYYNVAFQVSARKEANGTLDDLQIAPTCTYPSKGVLYTALGTPLAADNVTIQAPVYIPSCPEYSTWFECQHDSGPVGCKGLSATAPSCPADNPDFPRADYPVQ